MASSRSQAYAKRRRQAQKRRQQNEQLQIETLEPKVLLAGNTSTEVAQIVSVVPQPITRTGETLSQAKNQIDVYFNDVDLIDSSASAENPALYQLIYTADTITNTDDTVINPISVNYNPSANKAVLSFANDISSNGDAAFRLRVNTRQPLQTEPLELTENTIYQVMPDDGSPIDAGSSFATAASVTGASVAGDRLTGAITIDGSIAAQDYSIAFPGSDFEPGMRVVSREPHYFPILDGQEAADNTAGVTAIAYNFQTVYGTDPLGNDLQNAITPNQKDRAREIFDVYGSLFGLSFFETADEGLTVATGDLRGAATAVNPTYVLDLTQSWDDSVGGTWYVEAMRGIGQLLGMGTTPEASGSSVTTNLGAGTLTPLSAPAPIGPVPPPTQLPTQLGLEVERIFPGDASIVLGQRLWRPDGRDIDLYRFQLNGGGRFSAETIAERLPDSSLLDTMLTLFNSSGEVIGRNDDYFSEDSLIDLDLESGTYFIGVTASGNTFYDPSIEDTGLNGTSEGDYRLRLDFRATSTESLIARAGTALDGDGDGQAGGVFNYWFEANSTSRTVFVDKSASDGGDGSLNAPYNQVDTALNAAANSGRDIVRILGNGGADGDVTTLADNQPYEIGFDNFGQLDDGGALVVPRGVTVMVDAGAIFKMRSSYVQVGTTTTNVDRSGAALQILGIPGEEVIFTSREDEAVGLDNQLLTTEPDPGEWGGIVFQNDLDRSNFGFNPDDTPRDFEGKGIFLNHINNADLRYGGGKVTIDSVQQTVNPIHLIDARPTISYNDITFSADAAVSANPDSFEESRFHSIDSLGIDYQASPFTSDYDRIGPDIQGNFLADNTTNALSIRIDTLAGDELERLTVSGRFDDTDIVHAVKENLIVGSTPGGPIQDLADGSLIARTDASLVIDPGIILKMDGSRIEATISAQIIAEGDAGNPVIITSINDDTFGGVTEQSQNPLPGDWGGIYAAQESRLSIDNAIIAYGGGVTRIPGSSAAFNTIEIHQAESARITNSQIQNSASGLGGIAEFRRAGRHSHEAGAIFVRGAQPVIIGNEITGTEGHQSAVITIDPNSLNATSLPDYGRSRGRLERYVSFDDNQGPLIRENVLDDNTINGMIVRPGVISTETVWDDTDIVHVMFGEIVVPNVFSAGGLRLESSPSESLVVKVDGNAAGFTASGTPLDIDDRIGGILNVVGQPGKPVVLTSLADDSVGAGLGLDSTAQSDTDQGVFTRPLRTNEAGSFQIDINFGPVIRQHPDIMAGVERAARSWERLLEDPISVTIDFEVDSLAQDNSPDGRAPGTFAIPNEFEPGGGPAFIVEPQVTDVTFDEIVNGIKSDSRDHEAFVLEAPVFDQIDVKFPTAPEDPFSLSELISINTANFKALFGTGDGEDFSVPSEFDADEARDGRVLINEGALGFIGTGSAPVFFDYDRSDGIQQGKFDFTGLMSSAIASVLGFRSSIEEVRAALADPAETREISITPMDLFRLSPGEGQTDFAGAPRALDPAQQSHVFYDGGVFDTLDLPNELRLKNGDIPLLADTLKNEFVNAEGALDTAYEHPTNLNGVYLGIGGQATYATDVEFFVSDQDRSVFDLIGYDVVGGAIPGDWRGIQLETYSHDRNVAVVNEYEDVNDREGSNRVPAEAQVLGAIARKAQDADENQRIGIRVHGFINNPNDVDVYSFDTQAGTELWIDIDRTSQALDTIVELVDANGITLARSDNSLAESLGEEQRFETQVVPAFDMNKSPFLSVDHYSTNPLDAGLRVVIPGNVASDELSTYFVRVRSAGNNPNVIGAGLTEGRYELQIRTQELDEIGGTSVQFADIRYAIDGVRVTGLPRHSPLTGEVVEDESANDALAVSTAADDFLQFGYIPIRVGAPFPAFPQPQFVGNVQTSDRGAIAISGKLEPLPTAAVDIDYYTFSLTSQAQLMFDVDYADGLGRADTTMNIYSVGYTQLSAFDPYLSDLIFSSADSGDRDDLPAPTQGADLDDLSRGSVGTLDPLLGPVSLEAGDYVISIGPSSVLVPFTEDQFSNKSADNPFLRAEPVTSLQRIADESFDGPALIEPAIPVLIDDNSIVPLTLADVPLFVSAPGNGGTDIFTVDTFQGGTETHVGTLNRLPEDAGGPAGEFPAELNVADIVLAERQLPPGPTTAKVEELLFGFSLENNDALSGNYLAISPSTALLQNLVVPLENDDVEIPVPDGCEGIGDDCIKTYRIVDDPDAEPGDPRETETVPEEGEGVQFEALTLRQLGNRFYEGFAVGHRNDPAIDNVIYAYDHLTGIADTEGQREDPPVPPATDDEDEMFGFSQLVERGVLFTDADRAALSTTVRENADTSLIVTAATGDDGQVLIADGSTLQVQADDGTLTTYEFDFGGDFSVQTESLGVPAFLQDGDQFSVNGQVYEIETGPVIVVGDIATAVDGGAILIGDLREGAPDLRLELDNDGVVSDGRVGVDINGLLEPADLAIRIADAINAESSFSGEATAVNDRVSLAYVAGTLAATDVLTSSGGTGVTAGTIAVRIPENSNAEQIAEAIGNAVDSVEVASTRIGLSAATEFDFSALVDRGVFVENGEPGVDVDRTAITIAVNATPEDVATAIAEATGGNGFDGVVTLPQDSGEIFAAVPASFAIEGQSPGGRITGIAFVNNVMFGVSDRGGLFRIDGIDAAQGASADYLEQSVQLLGTSFSGLTVGPADVAGGAYADLLFATDSRGNLHAFDTDGMPQDVFADGATSISTGVSGANGLQFSTAQVNLWDINASRAGDAGHGGGNSLHFGEVDRGRNIDLPGGVQGSVFSNEIDLSSFTEQDLPTLYFSYFMTAEETEFPVKRDAFRVFASDDSQGASAKGSWHLLATSDETPRDFDNDPEDDITIDVQPLFNNSFQDVPSFIREDLTPLDRDTRVPANGQRDTFPLQDRDDTNPPPFDPARLPPAFQPFEEPEGWLAFPEFDETESVWRQARVDLSPFAGSDSIRLRFDFSTAASFDLGGLGGVELKAIAGNKLNDGETLTVDGVTFEVDFGLSVTIPSAPAITDGELVHLLDNAGTLHQFEFTTDEQVQLESIAVPIQLEDTAETVSLSLANAINTAAADLGLDFSASIVVNRLTLTGAENLFLSAGSRLMVEGGGLDAGTEVGNVPISVDKSMTADEVATILAAAFVEELGAGRQENYFVIGNTIRMNGDTVSDPGPFGLANQLKGDEWGAFTSTVGEPAYRGLENEYRYYELEEEFEIDPAVLPFALPSDDSDDFPLDFTVQFEGVYVDDIIIGFKTRGEEVTNTRRNGFFSPDFREVGTTGFDRIPLVPDVFAYYPEDTVVQPSSAIATGDYRLEIRLATQEDVLLDQLDRTVESITLIAPPGIQVFDGKIFRVSDGLQTVTFEYNDLALNDGVNPDHVAVDFTAADSEAEMAVKIRDAINRSKLLISATSGDGAFEPGVVTTSSSRVNLIGNAIVAELDDPNGIESLQATFSGSGNRVRDQGQLIIAQSRISNSEGHGIIVEDALRDLPSYDWSDPLSTEEHSQFTTGDYTPQPGPAQTLREVNENSVTTGVVIANNVVAFNGEGGIKYGGDPNGWVMVAPTAGDPPPNNLEVWDGLRFSVTDNNGLTQTFEFHDLAASGGPRAPRRSGPSDNVGANDWEFGNIPIMFDRSDYLSNPPIECLYTLIPIPCEDRYLPAETDMGDRLQQAFERSNLDITVFRGKGHELFIEGAREILLRPRDARSYAESSPAGGVWAEVLSFATPVSTGQAPFGRIVNNTIVGLGGQFTDTRVDEIERLPTSPNVGSATRIVNDFKDVGIEIGDNADPTLLNNIVANFEIGVSVDFTAIDTVREGLVFQANEQSTLNTNLGDFAIQLANQEPLFVDLVNGNFYPAEGARIIDSSVDSLEERPELVTIKSPLGINPSPVLAPQRDGLGQLREDDPSIEPEDGIGRNAFKDRGAIDRVDFVGPRAILQNPKDNDANGSDLNPTDTNVALSALVPLDNFEIEFQDTSQLGGTIDGTGVDPLTTSGDAVVVLQDDVRLVEGDDYTINFDSTNSVLRIIPASGQWPAGRTYRIQLDGVRDLAGNAALDNQIGGGVNFTITTLLGTDFGDAPAEYGDASHDIAAGFFLGSIVTPDAGSLSDPAASNDSGDDGVLLPDEFLRNESNTVTVQASADGILDAWFDFNNNRVFDDGERIIASANLVAGANELTVNLPRATAGGELFARFRFTSEGIDSPSGLAPDGEVEDYVISVDGGAIWQNINNPFDVDNDGFVSPRDYLLISQEIKKSLASDPVTRLLDDPFVAPNTPSSIGFVDVTGDGFVSPGDLLAVVTEINNAASGEPPEVAADIAAAATTSFTVDPIGEILENPVVELPIGPQPEVLDEVFTVEDDDVLDLQIVAAQSSDAADDVFADSDWFADDSDL